ncbi:MAG: hypothetical protein HXS54_12870 [Theionarchaea archaeon]|nr:hypothetical protein [Theionarchaea archaeon]
MSSENDFKGFGDALINFLYSLAKSKVLKVWIGDKVSNYVLSQALIMSQVNQPGGLDKHEKGDYVEGYIAKAWIDGLLTTDEAVTILVKNLKKYDLEEREQEGMVEAFRELLNYIQKKKSLICLQN